MQGTELVALVRDKIGDDAYDSKTILTAGNWFLNELANKNRLRIFEESDKITAAAGKFTADFPSDMQTMISLYVTAPSTYDFTKSYIEYGDFMKSYANFATASPGRASQWTDFGNAIRFSAPLNVTHSISVDYLRRPRQVEGEAGEYELPRQYDELLVKGALIRIMDQDEDYDVSGQERSLLSPMVASLVKNEGRGGIKTGPIIMRTNRGRRSDW